MTIEQFKNNWQPQMDSYARFSFNLDLKELVQQIRADAIEDAIHRLDNSKAICHEDYVDGIDFAIGVLTNVEEQLKGAENE